MKGESKRRALSLPSRPLRFRFSPESSSSPISAYSGGGSSDTASAGGFGNAFPCEGYTGTILDELSESTYTSSSDSTGNGGGGDTAIERLGEVEKRTEDDGETDRRRFTRVGDVGRARKFPDRVAKLDDGDDMDDEQNRSDGDIER
nr:hypothetical protein Iba_chr03bCG2760 [Ipomoea batatas]